jgi:hypothetical protein
MLERQRREDAAADAAEAAAFTALLSSSEQQRHDGLPGRAGMTETEEAVARGRASAHVHCRAQAVDGVRDDDEHESRRADTLADDE